MSWTCFCFVSFNMTNFSLVQNKCFFSCRIFYCQQSQQDLLTQKKKRKKEGFPWILSSFFIRYFLKGFKIILRWMPNSAMLLSISANTQSSLTLKDDHITVSTWCCLCILRWLAGSSLARNLRKQRPQETVLGVRGSSIRGLYFSLVERLADAV